MRDLNSEATAYYAAKAQNRTFEEAKRFLAEVFFVRYKDPKKPLPRLPKVQIAGTNGKGSTATMLANILTHAGYKTGLYTSPSLCRVNERIAIDGTLISDEALIKYIPIIRAAENEINFEFGGFDRITAACCLYFMDMEVDIAVMETGLGGRFDTVSAIEGLILSSLTSIGMDHMHMLGNTIEEIARDKCGILRPEVPVISHPQTDAAFGVIEAYAKDINAPLGYIPSMCTIVPYEETLTGQTFSINVSGREYRLDIALLGHHQRINAANALCCALELNARGIAQIPDNAIYDGLRSARIFGRMHILSSTQTETLLILDGAHNVGAMNSLMASLASKFVHEQKYTAIVSVMRDKDVYGIVEAMSPYISHAVCVDVNSRSLPADELSAVFESCNVSASVAENTAQALCRGMDIARSKKEPLLVTGSFYLVGALLELCENKDIASNK